MADTVQLPPVVVTGKAIASYKVKIVGDGYTVRFEASVPVSESRAANYEGYNIVHLPTSLWAYRNTNGRRFSITGKMVSRTPGEAAANAAYLQTIRSWVLPGFGTTGSTPPIVFLSAYNNQNIKKVPCIIQSYSWTFPDDVDYIFDTDEPMPVIGTIQLELEEAYSANQISNLAWKISPKSGGEFSYTGEPGTGSTAGSIGVDNSIQQKIASGTFGGLAGPGQKNNFPTLGGPFSLSPGMIAKLPSMASNVVRAATNSPTLAVLTESGLGLANRFIGGTPAPVINSNSNVSTPPIAPTPNSVSEAFGRLPLFGKGGGG